MRDRSHKSVSCSNGKALLVTVLRRQALSHHNEPWQTTTERRRLRGREETRSLQPSQTANAKPIFKRLQALPHLSTRIPHLRPQHGDNDDNDDSDGSTRRLYELVYPSDRFYMLVGDPSLPQLTGHEVRQLRDYFIKDVSLLYDNAHIAYIPDLAKLRLFRKTRKGRRCIRPVWRPFLDGFNLDGDTEEDVSWTSLKAKCIAAVKAQFAVIEVLADITQSVVPTRMDLDPDILVQILRTGPRSCRIYDPAILHVNRYSSELGQFVAKSARGNLSRLPRRLGPCDAPTERLIYGFTITINHVLQLLDDHKHRAEGYTGDQDGEARQHQADRIALLVAHAAFLIHIHARTIDAYMAQGILDLDAVDDDSPDSYTSEVGFVAVKSALSEARRLILQHKQEGGCLDEGTASLVRLHE